MRPALTFEVVSEDQPGPIWSRLFHERRAGYDAWFLSEGAEARATYMTSRDAMAAHMPELVTVYDRLVEAAGGDDLAARFLSGWCPPRYITACSQAVWLGHGPALVRNYDYDWRKLDGVLLESRWGSQKVLGVLDSGWGVLDGINEGGVSVSLTFGGRQVSGRGFGVPHILRYVLEFSRDARDAKDALRRVPCHMAYNVTVLDASGDHFTVYLSPEEAAVFRDDPIATNHQGRIDWEKYARATATVQRLQYLRTLVDEPALEADEFIAQFLKDPLYARQWAQGFGTLYTAAYWPEERRMKLLWPGVERDLEIGAITPEVVEISP